MVKRGKELELRKMMSRWRFDIRTQSDGDITENQREENRMRDIHVDRGGSETASEEQTDSLRKTVRFEQEAPSALTSSDPSVAQEYPASGEIQKKAAARTWAEVRSRWWRHTNFCTGCAPRNGWTRYLGEVLDCRQGEDVRDSKELKSFLLVWNLTCLYVFEGKFGKIFKRS